MTRRRRTRACEHSTAASRATITATATQHLSRFNLDLIGLTVDEVTVDGRAAGARRDGDELVVTPARGLVKGRPFVVAVRYHVVALAERVSGRQLDGLFAAWLTGSVKPPNPDPLPPGTAKAAVPTLRNLHR